LETRKWTDQNGANRETIEIVADNVNALDRPREEGGAPAASGGGRAAAPPSDEYDPFADE
ncbi:MAG: single-stranded DNA-binding protein, partial [Armatimonadota bacterium]